jgi:hypothetical protein
LSIALGLFFILGTGDGVPEIKIKGDNPVIIQQGKTYKDAGATADDIEDGEVEVITTGLDKVDTTTIGSYEITYTATDQDGHTTTAIRKILVIAANDTIPPVITLKGDNPVDIEYNTIYKDAGTIVT